MVKPKSTPAKLTTATAPERRTWQVENPHGIWGDDSKPATGTPPQTTGTRIGDLKPGNGLVSVEGRISNLSSIREFEKDGQAGTVFTLTILDASGEVNVACFNLETVRATLQINGVIHVSHCYVKLKDDIRSLTTTSSSIIKTSDKTDFPELNFNFIPLAEISALPPGQRFDFMAVCHKIEVVMDVPSYAPKYKKRLVFLTDDSRAVYAMNLWGDNAIGFEPEDYSVVVVRAASLQEFMGKQYINVNPDSLFWQNPSIPAATNLLSWFKSRVSTPFPHL